MTTLINDLVNSLHLLGWDDLLIELWSYAILSFVVIGVILSVYSVGKMLNMIPTIADAIADRIRGPELTKYIAEQDSKRPKFYLLQSGKKKAAEPDNAVLVKESSK